MKRPFDVTIAALLFVPALLICLAVALPIAIESRASPIFVQERLGRHESRFRLLKLRTMRANTPDRASHEIGESTLLLFGKWLRRLKIDELPQVWNVLVGDMSFVGPRPSLPTQLQLIEARRARGIFGLVPGITGPAQIRGVDMSTPELLAEVDSTYDQPWSLKRDLAILAATFFGAGSGDAATAATPREGGK